MLQCPSEFYTIYVSVHEHAQSLVLAKLLSRMRVDKITKVHVTVSNIPQAPGMRGKSAAELRERGELDAYMARCSRRSTERIQEELRNTSLLSPRSPKSASPLKRSFSPRLVSQKHSVAVKSEPLNGAHVHTYSLDLYDSTSYSSALKLPSLVDLPPECRRQLSRSDRAELQANLPPAAWEDSHPPRHSSQPIRTEHTCRAHTTQSRPTLTSQSRVSTRLLSPCPRERRP